MKSKLTIAETITKLEDGFGSIYPGRTIYSGFNVQILLF